MNISLRNPITGEIRVQQTGWSWSCFIGTGILGIALFRRGLPVWGAVMAVLNVTIFSLQLVPADNVPISDSWVFAIGVGLSLFFGLKANEMALNRYLTHGWVYADPKTDWFRSGPAIRPDSRFER